jgi:Cu-Zn family superoxide dismutase
MSIQKVSKGGSKMKVLRMVVAGLLLSAGSVWAADMTVTINSLDEGGVGPSIGTITVSSSPYGTIFTPDVNGLTPGLHGFHVHENPSCAAAEKDGKSVPGLAAGGHYDPSKTGRHEGPYGKGHLGDLPPLYADQNGHATLPVLAPRIKISDLKGRSLMIHAGGDNYSDSPQKLGGGGARVACGVIK